MREVEWGHQYVAELCEAIWQLEREHRLDEWEVAGRPVWPAFRMHVYYAAARAAGFFGDPHPAKPRESDPAATAPPEDWQRLLRFHNEAQSRRRPWLRFRRSPGHTLLIPHHRQVDGFDIYTRALAAGLGGRAMVVDREPHGDAQRLDLVTARRRTAGRVGAPPDFEVPPAELARYREFLTALHQLSGADVLGLADDFEGRLQSYLKQAWAFEEFLKFARTRELYLTDSYFTPALMAAAKARRVRTVELQHGFISAYHLGYSYPNGLHAPLLPDEFWTFGEYWTGFLPPQVQTRVIGAPYVAELALKATEPRDPDLIVFTSQGVLEDRLLRIAIKVAERRPANRVVYRLHPSESLADYESALPHLGDLPPNFQLSAKHPNIFALLGSAGVQVGVFSTTLLEGMSLGCRTVVLALPGHEYMLPTVQRGDASFAATADEVLAAIDAAPLCSDASVYYATPVDKLP